MKNLVQLLIETSDFRMKFPCEIRTPQRSIGTVGMYHLKKRIDNNKKKFSAKADFVVLRGGAAR